MIVQASRRSAERERVRVAGWQALETVKRLKDAVRGPHADAVLQQAQLVLFAGLG